MKHIIWDFNGTLLNDVPLAVRADNEVFRRLGLPLTITAEDYRRHMTMPVRDFYTALGVDLNVYSYDEITRIWLSVFNAGALSAGLAPGALRCVEALHAAGATQSVLSASYEPTLLEQCAALGLTPYMAALDGLENENAERKTAIGKRQLARLGLSGADCALVGDLYTDAELAAELGAGCVLVPWGHSSRERLVPAGVPIADSFDQLQDLLLHL